jgi:hypothetical protein
MAEEQSGEGEFNASGEFREFLNRVVVVLGRVENGHAKLEASVERLETGQAKMEAEQERLRTQLNTKLDDILDRLKAVREDTDNTRAHVYYGLQENLTLSQRITKLEEEIRRKGGDP